MSGAARGGSAEDSPPGEEFEDLLDLDYARDILIVQLADAVRTLLITPSPAGRREAADELKIHREVFDALLEVFDALVVKVYVK